jgi:cell wall-associated NlpC family hydrolase
VELDGLLAQKKKQSSNYDAEIKKARQEASVAKTKLQQEQQRLKNLQGGTTSAASGTYTTDYNSVIDKASGSSLGKQIAKYACQYIGNPYVAGGTSLTNGADCSGFTYRVYSDFGYTLPRTSTEQRSAGTGVSYSEAQPGDLICYSGHVALYIGGGLIVHASTQKTGIKVSNAEYRTILAVRRII